MGTCKKKTMLVLCDYYLPGYKAGGPIRTISNIVSSLSDHMDFRIISRDRDVGDKKSYPGIIADAWSQVEQSQMLYLSPGLRSTILLCRVLITSHYDTLYLNSLFSRKFTILPLLLFRLKLTQCRQVVLAPRGSCAASALRIKRFRKSLFLRISNSIGLFESVVWHASSEHEAADILDVFRSRLEIHTVSSPVVIAPDIPALIKDDSVVIKQKIPGALRIIFLGRVVKMKNLDYALSLFRDLKGEVVFDIYGPLEDKHYWGKCTKQIESLSQNIKVSYCGDIDHNEVSEKFKKYHILLLPTLGENFGHVILEALAGCCPVIISDRTPWRDLEEKGAGWDIPLERRDLFKGVLQKCIDMDQADYSALSAQSKVLCNEVVNDDKIIQKHIDLFCRNGTERHF
jgi:glycosyltransferase involved in cell wall biosynthesis